MKKIFLLILFLSLLLPINAQKKLTSKDSTNLYFKELFRTLKNGYLLKNDIKWNEIEKETNQNLDKYNSFVASLDEIEVLFNKIGARHCNVYINNRTYSSSPKSVKEKLSEESKAKYADNPTFETKVINDEFGYILIPKIVFSDISSENIHKVAQPLYDQIANLKLNNNLKGWIVDLRFNTGGNSWPMVLALYDFLGDNKILGNLNADKKQENIIKLENGAYYDNSKKVSYINPKGKLLDNEKVAIITSPATGSSGEIVALSFKGRKNTIFIGQETYGATTGNIKAELPFKSYMALTTSYDCDRNGNYYETVIPDISISNGDNYTNLMSDSNIKEAIKYFKRS